MENEVVLEQGEMEVEPLAGICFSQWDFGGCGCQNKQQCGHTLCGCTTLADQIQGNHSWFGDFTLNRNQSTGQWTGTSTYSYQNMQAPCPACTGRSVTLTWSFGGSLGCKVHLSWVVLVVGGVGCPDDTGANKSQFAEWPDSNGQQGAGGGAVTCNPGFSITWPNVQVTAGTSLNCLMFGGRPPQPYTLTLTGKTLDCPACFQVNGCAGALSGATVTITSGPTGTTGADGLVILDIGTEGNYEITVSAPGYPTVSRTLALACGQKVTVQLLKPFQLCVQGCNLRPLAGATISIPAIPFTATTDATGCATLPVNPGGYLVNISKGDRYTTQSQQMNITCGGATTVNLAAAPGYCCNSCFLDPIPNTLHYSLDGVGGTWNPCAGNLTVCLNKPAGNTITYPSLQCDQFYAEDPCNYGGGNAGAKVTLAFACDGGGLSSFTQLTDCGVGCSDASTTNNCLGQLGSYYSAVCGSSDPNSYQAGPLLGPCSCIWIERVPPGPQNIHFGANGSCTYGVPLASGNPVPVNITINFPPGDIGMCACFPLFNTLTITE